MQRVQEDFTLGVKQGKDMLPCHPIIASHRKTEDELVTNTGYMPTKQFTLILNLEIKDFNAHIPLNYSLFCLFFDRMQVMFMNTIVSAYEKPHTASSVRSMLLLRKYQKEQC